MIDTTNKYQAKINNMFYKGNVVFGLTLVDGKYDIDIDLDDADFELGAEIIESEVEDNTIISKVSSTLLPGKTIDMTLTFEDDKCNGFLKIPFVGKVKIKDAKKV